MSLLALNTRRALLRSRPLSRSLVVDAPAAEWVAKREAVKHHAIGESVHFLLVPTVLISLCLGTTDLWRKIRFVFCSFVALEW
jgi:hypothetical protein